MGFPKQEYWSGLPFSLPGDLLTQRWNESPSWQRNSLPLSHLGSPFIPPRKNKNKQKTRLEVGILGLGRSQVSISEDSSFLTYECVWDIDYSLYPNSPPQERMTYTHGCWGGRLGWPCSLWCPFPPPSPLSHLVIVDWIRGGLLTHPRQPFWPSDVWPSTTPIRFLLSQCRNKKDLKTKKKSGRGLPWRFSG